MWTVEALQGRYVSIETTWEWLPYQRSVHQDQLLDKIKSDALFGDVQCDIKVREHLR